MIGAKITNRLVVAHMCKGEITNRDASLLVPMLLILNQYFNTFIPETVLLYISLVNIKDCCEKQSLILPPAGLGRPGLGVVQQQGLPGNLQLFRGLVVQNTLRD